MSFYNQANVSFCILKTTSIHALTLHQREMAAQSNLLHIFSKIDISIECMGVCVLANAGFGGELNIAYSIKLCLLLQKNLDILTKLLKIHGCTF